MITQLRRCERCKLLFRTPTDDPADNVAFYETQYSQGFTSDAPSDAALSAMKASRFANTEKNYDYYIGVLRQLGLNSGAKIFDYGCSWGYGSYQLSNVGYEVLAFEVAPNRRRYAQQKLGVAAVEDMDRAADEKAESFDCFFSAHVLEHVPSPSRSFEYAMKLLKPGGIFVSFTPNGSSAFRAVEPNWSKLWGEVHPNFLDDIFLDYNFRRSPRVLGSSPVANISMPVTPDSRRLNANDGDELFFAARKDGPTWG